MEKRSSTTASKIQNSFLTCPVCFEVYSNPKCLPCLHTFCYHCLLSYIESMAKYGFRAEKGFPCPVCKQKVEIENYRKAFDEWLDEIPNNFLIQNMIDCLAEQDPPETRSSDVHSVPKEESTPTLPTEIRQEPRPSVTSPLPAPSSSLPSAPPAPQAPPAPPAPPARPAPPAAVDRSGPSSGIHTVNTSYRDSGAGALNTWTPSFLRSNTRSLSLGIAPNSRVTYKDTNAFQKVYDMTADNWNDYKPTMLSDVICLPKHNGIIALDYDNRCVKYVKNVFLGRNVTTATEVVGRPCCVSLLDKNNESVVVVSVLNRKKLYFIRVPELTLIDIMDTQQAYRGLTVLSPTAILAGSQHSAENPARLDLIRLDYRYKMITTTTIFQNGNWNGRWNVDVYMPHYIAALSETQFVVSDAQTNCLVFYDIQDNSSSTMAVKQFTLLPSEYQPFLAVGGMCFHNGCLYFVDKEAREVHKVSIEEQVVCETILKGRDGLWKPASVCVGPRGEVCVVNWEGKVNIFRPR